jgi:hypothetical protein
MLPPWVIRYQPRTEVGMRDVLQRAPTDALRCIPMLALLVMVRASRSVLAAVAVTVSGQPAGCYQCCRSGWLLLLRAAVMSLRMGDLVVAYGPMSVFSALLCIRYG